MDTELKPLKRVSGEWITIQNFIKFIHDNLEKFESMGIEIHKSDIDVGDDYYQEHGYEYDIIVFDQSYNIGNITVIEDNDGFAQADFYTRQWVEKSGHIQGSQDTLNELYDIFINYKKLKREKILNNILK